MMPPHSLTDLLEAHFPQVHEVEVEAQSPEHVHISLKVLPNSPEPSMVQMSRVVASIVDGPYTIEIVYTWSCGQSPFESWLEWVQHG